MTKKILVSKTKVSNKPIKTIRKTKDKIWASKVLMIKPTCFYLNEETFGDNKFMVRSKLSKKKTT